MSAERSRRLRDIERRAREDELARLRGAREGLEVLAALMRGTQQARREFRAEQEERRRQRQREREAEHTRTTP